MQTLSPTNRSIELARLVPNGYRATVFDAQTQAWYRIRPYGKSKEMDVIAHSLSPRLVAIASRSSP